MTGGGLRTKNPLAPFHVVEINLQNALFGQQGFQQQRQHQLLAFAQLLAFTREQQVLGQLLGDGGAAKNLHWLAIIGLGCALLGFLIAGIGSANGIPFDTAVLGEARIF